MPVVCQHTTRVNDNHKAQLPERPTLAFHCHPPAQLPSALSHCSPVDRASLQPHTDDRAGMNDIARYLVCRELVNSGFIKLNEHPEDYFAWKSYFLNATGGLNLTASEELDLLTKWLGNESAKHVIKDPFCACCQPCFRLKNGLGSTRVVLRLKQ